MTKPKTYSKPHHARASETGAHVSREALEAMQRVNVEMPLADIMRVLAEHGVKIYHVHGVGAEAIILTGGSARKLASQIYEQFILTP